MNPMNRSSSPYLIFMFTKLSQKKLSNALLNSTFYLHAVLICQSRDHTYRRNAAGPLEVVVGICSFGLRHPRSSLQIFKPHPLSDCLNPKLPSVSCKFFKIWPQFTYHLHLHQNHSFYLKPSISNFLLFIKHLSLFM